MTSVARQIIVGEGQSTRAPESERPDSPVLADIARLLDQIERETSAVQGTLNKHLSSSEGGYLPPELAARRELRRQLGALRENIALARLRSGDDPIWWRAELATLLSFARTLRSDAEAWRTGFGDRLRTAARQRAAARQERARLCAERAPLIERRDELQAKIDQTAIRMADEAGGEYRRTFPRVPLAEAVSVCSVWVLRPRSRPWPAQRWLVTLNGEHDQVLVRRCYA
jgi:hypothetical protein